jgi:polyvinyl alcohol dehydrogenase (cytochrome)
LVSSHTQRSFVRVDTLVLAGALLAVSLTACSSPAARRPLQAPLRATTSSSPTSITTPAASSPPGDWTVYHGDPGGTGVAPSIDLSPAHQVWESPVLDGTLFGEPLIVGSTVIVATENDTVVALSATTGKPIWSTHLATPVPASSLPCGDITPTVGITSTPVVDRSRHEVFVVADEEGSSGPEHEMVGLSLINGAVMVTQNVDPPGADISDILQRSALALDDGRVLFGYGGNFGLCTDANHGWLFSVSEFGGPPEYHEFDAQAGNSLSGVWMGGAAPVIDAQGHIWVGDGNGSATSGAYDGSEAVVELSTSLQILQYFAPTDWAADNAGDRDLGSSAPALLSDGLVVQAGKSHIAFLLNGRALGGIGGQLTSDSPFCTSDVDGGDAIDGSVVYLPCGSGVIAAVVAADPPSLKVVWQTTSGAGGPPIVAGGEVWSIDRSGVLYGLDPLNGAVVQQFSIGSEANHFPTPSVGDGLLLAPAANQVFAFAGP